MSKDNKTTTSDDPYAAGIDPDSQPTNQEAIPIPYVAGLGSRSIIFISPPYNLRAVPAPASGKGSK